MDEPGVYNERIRCRAPGLDLELLSCSNFNLNYSKSAVYSSRYFSSHPFVNSERMYYLCPPF